MNVKKTIAIFFVGALAVVSVACSSGDATPTRTRVAEAQPTQTPWIIYLPVTVTPGPATATLEATSTPSVVEPTVPPPTNTRRPVTAAPPQPTKPPQPTTPAEPPTAEPPTATPAPSCGQAYQVTTLAFPENGAKRDVKEGTSDKYTVQFQWEPVVPYEVDPTIGYRVNVSSPRNSIALYISHNTYLKEQRAVLRQHALYELTGGDDATGSWNVEVIKSSGEFNDVGDDAQPPIGTVTPCGPSSPTWSFEIQVIE